MVPRPHTSRAESRARMEAAILERGRAQLAERGAAALSLREVARSLDVASSAVYRYVKNREDLLTWLLVDAYSSLADAVDDALADEGGAARRLLVFAESMRGWALAHPEQWGLIYGNPVPGYAAPDETTTPGLRVVRPLFELARHSHPTAGLTVGHVEYLEGAREDLHVDVAPEHGAFAVRAWCTIVGTISMEVFGQLGPEPLADPVLGASILRDQVSRLAGELRLA